MDAIISIIAVVKNRRRVEAGACFPDILREQCADSGDHSELPEIEMVAAFACRVVERVYRRTSQK